MFKLFAVLALTAAAGAPQSSPVSPPAPVIAAPAEEPAVTALARTIYAQMRQGKVDATLLTDAMNQHLTPEVLAQLKPMFDQLGDPTKLTLQARASIAAGTLYDYLAEFAAAALHVRIVVDSTGRVAGYTVTLT